MSFTGADVVAEALAALDVRHAFAIVSIHNMPILDAIRRRGATEIVDVRHEQGGTHAADGYARATGKLGVMIASTGPGTTNTLTGLYEAAYASSPVLLITGQAETGFYGKGLGYVHEAEQQLAMLRAVTRRAESPRRGDEIAPAIASVVRDMCAGRAQPGAVEIPIDLQYAPAPPGFTPPAPFVAATGAGLDRAAELLGQSRRRLIVAGGGVIAAGAGAALASLAERLDVPVVTTANGRGALPETHRLAVGNLYAARSVQDAIAGAEVTLAIGTRFQAGVDGRQHPLVPPGALVHIDLDPATLGRAHRAAVGVVADARLALEALVESARDSEPNDAQFNAGVLDAAHGLKEALRRRLGDDYAAIMDAMRETCDAATPIVRDSTQPAYFFANQLLPILAPRTSMSPTSGAIGPGLPLGIGAAIGSGRRTLVIHGDGGFMLHATELATAAQYQVPVTVCVFNDGGYGVLRGLQARRFDGRINDTDLGAVDFPAMAVSMNVPALKVTSAGEFAEGLARSKEGPGPFLIEVDMTALTPIEGTLLPAAS